MKILSIILAAVLVAVIVYGVVITKERDALNTELDSVEAVLASTQAELSSTKQTLTATQAELSSTKQILSSVQNELEAVQAKLKLYEDTMGIKIFSGIQQPPLRGAGPIELVNNSAATDPSWQQLFLFLRTDPTDDRTWTEGIFVSGDFAEMLHNNAEAAGIRAALVGVFFEGKTIGHGLNAFKTTDRGLVYVDNTGSEELSYEQGYPTEWDKIAYLVKGKEYGLISISMGYYSPHGYDTYEQMKVDRRSYIYKLEVYKEEVREFNDEVRKFDQNFKYEGDMYWTIVGSTWWLKIMRERITFLRERLTPKWTAWELEIMTWERALVIQERELDSLRRKLGAEWEPLGIVSNINIYW